MPLGWEKLDISNLVNKLAIVSTEPQVVNYSKGGIVCVTRPSNKCWDRHYSIDAIYEQNQESVVKGLPITWFPSHCFYSKTVKLVL